MDSHCSCLHWTGYDDNSRIFDFADMPAELTTAHAPVERGGLNLLKLGCEKLAAWDVFAVFESDQVGFAGGSRKAGDLFDKVVRRFYNRFVGFPLAAEESNCGRYFIGRSVADKLSVL